MAKHSARFKKQRSSATSEKKTDSVDILAAPTFLGIPQKKFRDIIEELPVSLWMHDENYIIVHTNNMFKDTYGDCMGRPCYQSLMQSDSVCKCCLSGRVLQRNSGEKCSNCSCRGENNNIQTFHYPVIRKDGSKYILKSTIVMDNLHSSLKEFEYTEESPADDIASMFWTMCSACKNIKDDKGNWVNLENYLVNYFNIIISHGICPDCIEKLYPGISRQ
jgi:hypothetical protein